MRTAFAYWPAAALALVMSVGGLIWFRAQSSPVSSRDAHAHAVDAPSEIDFAYPVNGTVFPPESIPPKFRWSSPASGVDSWRVQVTFENASPIDALVSKPEWTPDELSWSAFKRNSVANSAHVRIVGVTTNAPKSVVATGSLTLTTSADPVGAPLFYREVPLPFIEAVKDPGKIRWRFGSIDSRTQPPVVLENLPVCGNCHSFSSDGRVLGMDVDYANDKGSYVLTDTSSEITLSRSKVITWSDYRRTDKQPTFGLLSQISPDGRYAVSTVKDRSVFVPKADVEFSQLFFPIKGILAFYDRQNKTFAALPGADDPRYVHSNPSFSPDGKQIVFARAEAYDLRHLKDSEAALLSQQECREFLEEGKTFRFDLYRIPFNGGKGGTAVPLQGASGNNRSNFFARYSPDGKWIVFCQANSFMLLQPDSELYVIPAQGGEARRLDCNTNRMNSWHSWSPNGKWLVFSSKAHTPYTQLMLAHMDEQGQCAPPIVLSEFTAPDRAANIPEFVNLPAGAIRQIRQEFVDDESYMRTALENIKGQNPTAAAVLYRKALDINPENADAHAFLGGLLADDGQLAEAREHLSTALRLNPKSSAGHYNLGNVLAKEQKYDQAMRSWNKALEIDPGNRNARRNIGAVLLNVGRINEAEKFLRSSIAADPADPLAYLTLGNVLSKAGRKHAAVAQWQQTISLDDSVFEAHQNLGVFASEEGRLEEAIRHFELALRSAPNNAACLMNLGAAYAQKGFVARAIEFTQQAAAVAQAAGDRGALLESQRRIRHFQQQASLR